MAFGDKDLGGGKMVFVGVLLLASETATAYGPTPATWNPFN